MTIYFYENEILFHIYICVCVIIPLSLTIAVYDFMTIITIYYVCIYECGYTPFKSSLQYSVLERWGFRNTQEFFAVFYKARFIEVIHVS